jgi:hypothetical protein
MTRKTLKYTPLPPFDELLHLAQHDPENLEKIRKELIFETISNVPHHMKHRLQGLQFQIDARREIARCPLRACSQISDMMLDSFTTLREELSKAGYRPPSNEPPLSQNKNVNPSDTSGGAAILQFRSKIT